jgi:hypothetical protein
MIWRREGTHLRSGQRKAHLTVLTQSRVEEIIVKACFNVIPRTRAPLAFPKERPRVTGELRLGVVPHS